VRHIASVLGLKAFSLREKTLIGREERERRAKALKREKRERE